jgi:hypothetical protein
LLEVAILTSFFLPGRASLRCAPNACETGSNDPVPAQI